MSKNSAKNKKPRNPKSSKNSNYSNMKTISSKIKSTVDTAKDPLVVSSKSHKLCIKTLPNPKTQGKSSNFILKGSNVLNFKNWHFIPKLNLKLPTEKEKFGSL